MNKSSFELGVKAALFGLFESKSEVDPELLAQTNAQPVGKYVKADPKLLAKALKIHLAAELDPKNKNSWFHQQGLGAINQPSKADFVRDMTKLYRRGKVIEWPDGRKMVLAGYYEPFDHEPTVSFSSSGKTRTGWNG